MCNLSTYSLLSVKLLPSLLYIHSGVTCHLLRTLRSLGKLEQRRPKGCTIHVDESGITSLSCISHCDSSLKAMQNLQSMPIKVFPQIR